MKYKIGIIQERKTPPDSRVTLTPEQCRFLKDNFEIDIKIAPCIDRCYKDLEFQKYNIELSNDFEDCDLLLGVKEVPINYLLPNKRYMFFSHTIKKQEHNRKLLQAVLEKNITLIDYETLCDANGKRLIAFGYYAGVVGAHNGIWAYGKRTKQFELPRMKDCHDYAEIKSIYDKTDFPNFKIILTGSGRVGSGAKQTLLDMGVIQKTHEEFLNNTFDYPTFTQLNPTHYAQRKDGESFSKQDYYANPQSFKSNFEKFYKVADIFINGIYYDDRAPAFFTVEDMKSKDFKIKTIADISCDIVPHSSVPSTLFASTIAEPLFGFNPHTNQIDTPLSDDVIDMMTIDNLPNELPRDASESFGNQFIKNILPELFKELSTVISNATIASGGKLTERFMYLEDYLNS